jgi:ABC-2 type transport system ATP-binding protein
VVTVSLSAAIGYTRRGRGVMIEVSHLSKSYGVFQGGRGKGGAQKAVDDISFRVEKGEVVGFLGPNGAGKSTTLRILAGFLGASSGRVRIAGHDIAEEPQRARAQIGYMPELSPLYPEMRAGEYLLFRAELKLIPRPKRRAAVAQALAQARIEDVEQVMIGHLSKGYRQRVGLADALLGSPPLLILDEPTAGLDPNQIREVRDLIRALGRDHTVFLSTHILPEVEATCGRALVIARGRLVAEGSIDALRARRRAPSARIIARGEGAQIVAAATNLAGVKHASSEPLPGGCAALSVDFADEADSAAVLEELVAALVGAGVGVREVAPVSASLEQIFAELTRDEAGADASEARA